MAIERRALLVLGMHRSGTSALTRVLNLYGAHLPDDLLPANSGNEAGYWESSAIFRFNEEFLASIGSRWDTPVWFSEPLDSGAVKTAADSLARLFVTEYGDAPLVVIKDPRICRLFPIWQAALESLGIRPLPVLIVRHPLEVAASLRRRDDMPEGLGLLLWLQYTLAAEQATRSLPRVAVFYEQLLTDPAPVLAQLQSTLGLALPADEADVASQVADFLRPGLRHERATADTLPHWVSMVYDWFARSRQGALAADTGELDRVRGELADAERLFGAGQRWHQQALESRVEHAEHSLRWWQEHAGNVEQRLKDAQAAWDHHASLHEAQLTAARMNLDEQRQQADSRLAAEFERRRLQFERVTRLEAQLAQASAIDTALRARLRELQERLANVEASARATETAAS